MKRFLTTIVLSFALILFSSTAFAIGTLYWTDDEGTIERDIAAYLKETHGYKSIIKTLDKDPSDAYLSISFNLKQVPDIEFILDTQPSSKSGSERVIKIFSEFNYGLTQDNPAYCAALSIINQFMDDKWMPDRIYIRPNGNLRLANNINIPGDQNPIPAEMVADTIVRTASAWKVLFQKLRDAGIHPF